MRVRIADRLACDPWLEGLELQPPGHDGPAALHACEHVAVRTIPRVDALCERRHGRRGGHAAAFRQHATALCGHAHHVLGHDGRAQPDGVHATRQVAAQRQRPALPTREERARRGGHEEADEHCETELPAGGWKERTQKSRSKQKFLFRGARAATPPPSREAPRRRCGCCTFASRGTTAWPPAGPCRTHGAPLRSHGRERRTRAPTPARPP